ncbi:embryo defective protein [Tanacetum coccineum]
MAFSIRTQMVDTLRNGDNEGIKNQVNLRTSGMTTYLWRKYADYLHTKWEKEVLWTMVDPYKRPKSFTPLVKIYVCAFYTGVIGAAITEQLYKEKYWEDHPGEVVPIMRPKFYGGPWKIYKGTVLPPNK